MTLCKFFVQGRCSYGDKCRFEHRQPYPGEGVSYTSSGFGNNNNSNSNNNRFGAFGGGTTTQQNAPSGPAKTPAYNAQTIMMDMSNDRPIWRLSCYSLGKEEPNVIAGAVELSPEESRLNYYTSVKLTGSDMQYQTEMSNILAQMEQQVQQIHANPQRAIEHVQQLKSQSQLGSFSAFSASSSTTQSSSTFGAQAAPPAGFGSFGSHMNPSSGFGAFSQPQQSQSAFGQTSIIRPAISAFGQTQSPQSSFGQTSSLGSGSSFNQTSSLGGGFGAFAQTKPAGTAFGVQPSGSSVFGSGGSAFGKTSTLGSSGTSTFGQTSSLGSNVPSAFGQPSTLGSGAPLAFGQPSAPGPSAPPAFGQTATLGSGSAFGQPFAMGSAGSAFGGTSFTQPQQGTIASTPALNQPHGATPSSFSSEQHQAATGEQATPINKEMIEAFMAPQFELRKVPECEPPPEVR